MRVIRSEENEVVFDNGLKVIGDGDTDCCAYNYIDFEQFNVGREFPTMTAGQFIDAITIKEDLITGKYSQVEIARKFNVSKNVVWRIKTGQTWGWL